MYKETLDEQHWKLWEHVVRNLWLNSFVRLDSNKGRELRETQETYKGLCHDCRLSHDIVPFCQNELFSRLSSYCILQPLPNIVLFTQNKIYRQPANQLTNKGKSLDRV